MYYLHKNAAILSTETGNWVYFSHVADLGEERKRRLIGEEFYKVAAAAAAAAAASDAASASAAGSVPGEASVATSASQVVDPATTTLVCEKTKSDLSNII